MDENTSIILGRLNGINALLLIIARQLPPAIAFDCLNACKISLNQIEASLIALPLTDTTIAETQRVLEQGLVVLQAAADQKR